MRFESALDLNGYSRAEAMRQGADQAQEHEFQERARERERYREFDQAEGKVFLAVTAKLRLLPRRVPGSACHYDTHDDFFESHETHQIQGHQEEWQAEADAEEEWSAHSEWMSTLAALVDDEWMAEWILSSSTAAVSSDQLAEYTDGAHTWVTTATPEHDLKWREEVRMKSHLLRYDRTRGPVPISPTAW